MVLEAPSIISNIVMVIVLLDSMIRNIKFDYCNKYAYKLVDMIARSLILILLKLYLLLNNIISLFVSKKKKLVNSTENVLLSLV